MFAPHPRTITRLKQGMHGFTLVEILVVIAIISVLTSILLPALSSVKERGRMVVCMNNIRQIAIAHLVYAGDNDGNLCAPNYYLTTTPAGWIDYTEPTGMGTNSILVQGHYINTGVFMCPSDRHLRTHPLAILPGAFTYSRNGYGIDPISGVPSSEGINSINLSAVPYAERTALLVEEADYSAFNDGYIGHNIAMDSLADKHFGKASMAFYDAHVQFIDAQEFNNGDQSWRESHYLWPVLP